MRMIKTVAQILTALVGAVVLASCSTTGQKTLTSGQLRSDTEECALYLCKRLGPDCKSCAVVDTKFLEKYSDGD